LLTEGHAPNLALNEPRYSVGSQPYLDVFRYFAKLMCCHLAEVGAPRPLPLAGFALGASNRNIISLAIDEDWTYREAETMLGPHQYAAHGGLVVYSQKTTAHPRGFHSTLTLGPLRYVYFIRLLWRARLELRLGHPRFWNWCRERGHDAMTAPLTLTEQLQLGLADSSEAIPN
jgi:hypothetical protein